MSTLKCKMCGGTIEFEQGATVGTCEYCGTKQTLPTVNDDVMTNLFNRANNLRLKCEFDKAEQIYEKIVEQNDSEAEAHWGIVLCKYGIEYVDDPATGKKIPTCHRTLFDAVTTDPDYLAAVDYSDAFQQAIYESEARAIDKIQKGILSIVKNEKPFDVFICYKETDENGKRTVDSALANDIYYQLTQEGMKVFYAAITLEDKLGQEYEPYIFAALNSAKVMLVLGTKPEHFTAVWVKNEWSRFMSLMKTDRNKLLIPCYRDMDAYDLPEEFAHLQAQDMGKIGFINDVVRGIKKLFAHDEPKLAVKETVVVNNGGVGTNIAPLLKRAFMFLEDGDWEKADDFCEQVLNQNPENAEAYLGKLMAELQVKSRKQLADCDEPFDGRDNYSKVIRFADEALKAEIQGYIVKINERNENTRLTGIYDGAVKSMQKANDEKAYRSVAEIFQTISGFKDAEELAKQCSQKAKEHHIATEKAAKKRKKVITISLLIIVVCIAFTALLTKVIIPNSKYNAAVALMNDGKYEEAIAAFEVMDGYKDSGDQIKNCKYNMAVSLMNNEKYEEAIAAFEALDGYEDSIKQIEKCNTAIMDERYNVAVALVDSGNIIDAYDSLMALNGYKDSAEKASKIFGQYVSKKFEITEVGDTIFYGTYEQDNDTSNGKENVEWQVLAKENNQVLLISKYALDFQKYNSSSTNITWEKCSLRSWLNDTFINNVFSSDEQAMIATTNVSADKNPKYKTKPGNVTEDKVFLLSVTEAEKYFPTDESCKCAPTAYTKAQGVLTSNSYTTTSGEATCWWWLRSPGGTQHTVAYVYRDGSICYAGNGVSPYTNNSVRPALWIDLSEIQ